MAIRLLPFRDYDEHDVVNLYRMDGAKGDFIDLSDPSRRSNVKGDAGVFVKVKNGSLNPLNGDWDPVDIDTNPTSLLGKTDYPHVGRNVYPQASLTVEPTQASAGEGQQVLGITLRQTVEKDENGENLLYNPIKKDELFGVYPGEAVPVLSKGMVTLNGAAFDGAPAVGEFLVPSEHNNGVASGIASASLSATDNVIGTVLASGFRHDDLNNGTNVFGNDGLMGSGNNGDYYVVKLNCA
jgi:hypothetical protein